MNALFSVARHWISMQQINMIWEHLQTIRENWSCFIYKDSDIFYEMENTPRVWKDVNSIQNCKMPVIKCMNIVIWYQCPLFCFFTLCQYCILLIYNDFLVMPLSDSKYIYKHITNTFVNDQHILHDKYVTYIHYIIYLPWLFLHITSVQ